MKAPMDVPPIMSTGMPHSVRARMMPTCAQPLHRQEQEVSARSARQNPGQPSCPAHPQRPRPAHVVGSGAKVAARTGAATLLSGSRRSASLWGRWGWLRDRQRLVSRLLRGIHHTTRNATWEKQRPQDRSGRRDGCQEQTEQQPRDREVGEV